MAQGENDLRLSAKLKGVAAAVANGLAMVGAASAAFGQDAGDARKGMAYAQQACAQCHGIAQEDVASPLIGLATFRMIANTPGMTGTAIAAWLQTPHNSMPNLIIPPADRDNVIAYILTLRDKRAQR